MHGSKHGRDERLDDHINGRCTPLPWTKSWQELGFENVPERGPKTEEGFSLFAKLTEEQQLAILGPAKFMAYREGSLTLKDLVGRRRSAIWGTMRYEKSLKDVLGNKAAKDYTRLALMGVAGQTGGYTADDLIRIAGVGLRDLTPKEIDKIVRLVAQAGFSNNLEKCRAQIAGLTWEGQVIKGSDKLPNGVVHYLRHVVAKEEWTKGTSINAIPKV